MKRIEIIPNTNRMCIKIFCHEHPFNKVEGILLIVKPFSFKLCKQCIFHLQRDHMS